MSRKMDKKIDNLQDKFRKVLDITGLRQGDLAIKAGIQPGTLSKSLKRESFSTDIVDNLFDKIGIRKEFWQDGKDPIIVGAPPSFEENRLLSSLERAMTIIEGDNNELWKQNARLLALVERLALPSANSNH